MAGVVPVLEYHGRNRIGLFAIMLATTFTDEKGLAHLHHYELNQIFSVHALNELYTTNILCVVVDSVSYDGQTHHHHPVVHSQRISGMPEVKQIYQRIELLDVKNVPISCSIC